jgi:hypothetical protein
MPTRKTVQLNYGKVTGGITEATHAKSSVPSRWSAPQSGGLAPLANLGRDHKWLRSRLPEGTNDGSEVIFRWCCYFSGNSKKTDCAMTAWARQRSGCPLGRYADSDPTQPEAGMTPSRTRMRVWGIARARARRTMTDPEPIARVGMVSRQLSFRPAEPDPAGCTLELVTLTRDRDSDTGQAVGYLKHHRDWH